MPIPTLLKFLLKRSAIPLAIIALSILAYSGLQIFTPLTGIRLSPKIYQISRISFAVIITLSLYWFLLKLLNSLTQRFECWSTLNHNKALLLLSPLFISLGKIIALLTAFNVLINYLAIPSQYQELVEKFTTIIIILAIAWLLAQMIRAFSELLLHRYDNRPENGNKARRLATQVHILRRIVMTVLVILTTAAILMMFDPVRQLGASLLASAGLLAGIVGLAAQQTLKTLLAGMQIAINQPIRIGDRITIDNDTGIVEEITLYNAILQLTDNKQLVIPINYFLEKSFQRWPEGLQPTCSIIIPVNYKIFNYENSLAELAKKFALFVQQSPCWNKQTEKVKLQVNNISPEFIELVFYASIDSVNNITAFSSEMRKQLLQLIHDNYAEAVPAN